MLIVAPISLLWSLASALPTTGLPDLHSCLLPSLHMHVNTHQTCTIACTHACTTPATSFDNGAEVADREFFDKNGFWLTGEVSAYLEESRNELSRKAQADKAKLEQE